MLAGTIKTNVTPDWPSLGGARIERDMCREVHVFHGSGVPSCDDHCQREDKTVCLACGEEKKRQREETLIILPQCVSACGSSTSSPSLPAWGGGAELLGVQLSSGGSGDCLGCWWQRREGVRNTVKVYRGQACLCLCCGFAVPAGSGLGVCPELGMKNGLNQSRFHQYKLLSSIPFRILVTRLIN